MLMIESSFRFSALARRTAAFAILTGAATLSLQAQQPTGEAQQPAKLVADASAQPVDLATLAGVNYSSSSSSSDSSSLNGVDPAAAERLDLSLASTQPPPRRRYGRPRYNDSSHNPDGSSKYAFVVGGGLTVPTGNTQKYLTDSYGFQVGVGRNFDKHFGIMAQFDYDHFGFKAQTIYNQTTLYNYYQAGFSGLDGSSHVWSFTLNPVFNFYQSDTTGAYLVAGVGFFHKTANFTVPATGTYFDPYYGPIQYQANQTVDKYTSNAPGFDGGIGFTYKPSRFASERIFVEGRYVFVDNSQRTGVTVNSSGNTLNAYNGNNFYPANSNRTTYPVFKAGLRF